MRSVQSRLDRNDVAIRAERAGRLGLLASLAFAQFVLIYRKYNEDQPRDDRGRWTGPGASQEVTRTDGDIDVTGAIKILNNAKTGDPGIDSITDKLVSKLSDIVDQIGPGSGVLYGIQVHSAFADAVRTSGIPNVEAETTWLDGSSAFKYGLAGSIRTDAVLKGYDDNGPVLAIWDVKTGNATLGQARLDRLRAEVGVGPEVPVIELNVLNGVIIKADDSAETESAHGWI